LKAPALATVAMGPEAFAPLFRAARELGLRVGWLDLETPAPPPPELAAAAEAGAGKAVAAGHGRSLSLKPVAGAPVLRDLLREHFLGYALVLVRGRDGRPAVTPEAGSYRLEAASTPARLLGAGELLRELCRPGYRA
jgi:hypothetical protein